MSFDHQHNYRCSSRNQKQILVWFEVNQFDSAHNFKYFRVYHKSLFPPFSILYLHKIWEIKSNSNYWTLSSFKFIIIHIFSQMKLIIPQALWSCCLKFIIIHVIPLIQLIFTRVKMCSFCLNFIVLQTNSQMKLITPQVI